MIVAKIEYIDNVTVYLIYKALYSAYERTVCEKFHY